MSRSIIKKQSSNADVNGDFSSRDKSVRFDPAARFILIRPSNGYATSNRSSPSSLIRYTDDDYNRIRKGVKKTIRAVRTFHEEYPDGNFDEHQESLVINEDGRGTTKANSSPRYSSRGLEHLRTAEYLEQQMINKDCAIESVLVAQERLDEEANTATKISTNASETFTTSQQPRRRSSGLTVIVSSRGHGTSPTRTACTIAGPSRMPSSWPPRTSCTSSSTSVLTSKKN